MRISSQLYLKWCDVSSPHFDGLNQSFSNLCALFAKDIADNIVGFTLFEPRDLNESFFSRLSLRRNKSEFSNLKYDLYVPKFLAHRIDQFRPQHQSLNLDITYTSFFNIKKQDQKLRIRSKVRVVSVDDSPVLLKYLKHSFVELEHFDVVAQFSDPMLCKDEIIRLSPDLITMDIQMPGKTGVELVKEILDIKYIPIIMISSLTPEEGPQVFNALNNGAFDYIQKPRLEDKAEFLELLDDKALSAVVGQMKTKKSNLAPTYKKKIYPAIQLNSKDRLLWCIGSSTGGTQALTQIFTSLPTEIPPVLIVQHIPPVFSKSFADSLNQLVPFTVKEATDGEAVLFNHAYIAPGGLQMAVEQRPNGLFIKLSDSEKVNRFKPSVDFLFNSIELIQGYNITACILTGMGKDGSAGLLKLKKMGASTFAQDEASSAVYGMPRAAYEIGATDKLIPLDEIAQYLMTTSILEKKVS